MGEQEKRSGIGFKSIRIVIVITRYALNSNLRFALAYKREQGLDQASGPELPFPE